MGPVSLTLPNYVRAADREGLRRAMLMIILRDNMVYDWQISCNGNEWTAWFSEKLDLGNAPAPSESAEE